MKRILLVLALLVLSFQAEADHRGDHRSITVGKMTEIPVHLMACADRESVELIVEDHEKNGLAQAMTRLQFLIMDGECIFIRGRITVHEVFKELVLDFEGENKKVLVIRYTIEDVDMPLFAALIGVEVFRGQNI